MSRKLDVVTLDGEEYDSLMADAERYRWLKAHRDGDLCAMAWNDLREYLLAHEGDIAHCIDDFGRLDAVFTDVVGRDAEKHVSPSSRDGDSSQ